MQRILLICSIIFLIYSCQKEFTQLPVPDTAALEKDLEPIEKFPGQDYVKDQDPVPNTVSTKEAYDIFRDQQAQFGFELLSTVHAEDPSKNSLLSPFSLLAALLMTNNGAEGTTKTAIQNTIGLDRLNLNDLNEIYKSIHDRLIGQNQIIIELANAAFWDEAGLLPKPDFLSALKQYFYCETFALDFKASGAEQAINNWVDLKTKGKIPRLLDQIEPEELLFLINALYMKANWSVAFDKEETTIRDFKNAMTVYPTEFMFSMQSIDFYQVPDYLSVGISLGDSSQFAMYIILPDEQYSLDQLIREFDYQQFNKVRQESQLRWSHLWVPKFELEFEIELNAVLSKMGMAEAFSNSANFSNIDEFGRPLRIKKAIQKTKLTVNEDGLDGAAITSISIGPTSAPPSIVIDRPFLFIIAEKTSGTVLFNGKLITPG